MIFSDSWLREWVDHELDVEPLVEALTMAGLEVDGTAPVANQFSGIIVAEVISVEPHPDADKLNVCQVNDGKNTHQVVCGAPNVAAGMKAPFATIGAEIRMGGDEEKPFKIKKAKLRGVESCGMLCSAEELGLEEKSDGLLALLSDAPIGTDIRDYLQLNDLAIELDLTPNRGDCLGIAGIAREVGVIARKPVQVPQVEPVAASIDDEFAVSITADTECPRYLGRIIRGINPGAATPLWMKEKLRRSGVRSIDPVVDVTNYVLLELGQPMHAFDLAKLKGNINVRMAGADEELTLLDGKTVKLTSDTLVIADQDKAVAMAGVMGGEATAVSDATEDVFLECAFFAPLAIAGKARSYGMHTDASHRYERGVDYELQERAMERATQLLLDIVGGSAGPVTTAIGTLPEAGQINLKLSNVERILGISMLAEEIADIFERLGFTLLAQSAEQISIRVPSFRFDLAIEADLIEEIARIYGYNNIPKTNGLDSASLGKPKEGRLRLVALRDVLTAQGYQEAITYSFIDPQLCQKVMGDERETIALQNPISEEMSVMRPSILPALLAALLHNQNRQQQRLRLFETGLIFNKEGGKTTQVEHIAGLICGTRSPSNWFNNKEISDFYDVKGQVEALLALSRSGEQFSFQPGQHPALHPGQCAQINAADGDIVGYVGALHPAVQQALGVHGEVYCFELQTASLLDRQVPAAQPLSKFPEVSRDLAIVVDESVPAGEILAAMREQAGEFLTDLRIFDVYQGDAVAKNKKSLALGLTWQHPYRTLSDDEINAIISSCVNALHELFNANLRD
ncbi:MAG: phenylalanine--tRNA ligase subunit beta [Gammaproteobacteria bacterium]